MQIQELISSVQRTNVDVAFGLAGTMVEGVAKLTELNARFTRSTLKDAFGMVEDTVKRPLDWMAIPSVIAAATAEKVQLYSREFLEIASSTQAEVLKATQTGSDAYVQRFQSLVEDATKDAPTGSEAAMAAWNSAIVAANTLFETVGRTGQQAVEVARSNFDVAAAAVSKKARRAIEQEQQTAK